MRSLQKHIDQIYRKGAMTIVSDPESVISVSPDNLEDFVGKPKVCENCTKIKPIL